MTETNTGSERQSRTGDLIMPVEKPGFERLHVPERWQLPPPEKAGILIYLLLIGLVGAVFSPLLRSDLLWTEHDQVQRGTFHNIEHWSEAWQVDYIRRSDPISTTIFFAEQALPLPPATTHRAVNLLLHLSAAILLLQVLQNLKLAGAIATTLVFALHPVVIQVLFWPGYREEITGLIALLSALYFGTRNQGQMDYLLTVFLTCIASLMHTAALAIPVLLALCTFYEERRFKIKDFNRVLPLLCICMFIGVWIAALPQAEPMTALDANDRMHYFGQNMLFSISQSLFPGEMALFYQAKESPEFGPGGEVSLLSFLLFAPFLLLAACNLSRRWSRAILLGLIAYLLLILPGVFTLGQFLDGSIAHEGHSIYIGLPALMALIVAGSAGLAPKVKKGVRLLWLMGVGLLLCLEVLISTSFAINLSQPSKMWHSMMNQWTESWIPKVAYIESALASDPDSLETQELLKLLKDILEKNPELMEPRILLARTYKDLKQTNNAIRQYKYLLREHEPDDAFLRESISLLDSVGMHWEADNVRKRLQERAANNSEMSHPSLKF